MRGGVLVRPGLAQGSDASPRVVGEQRTARRPAEAGQQRGVVPVEPDDAERVEQQPARRRHGQQASAAGDHDRRRGGDRHPEGLEFAIAEAGLALGGKDVGDRAPRPVLDQGISIDEPPAQAPCQGGTHGRLPAPGQADQGDALHRPGHRRWPGDGRHAGPRHSGSPDRAGTGSGRAARPVAPSPPRRGRLRRRRRWPATARRRSDRLSVGGQGK